MRLAQSTFYDTVTAALDAEEILTRIGTIYDEFECYGYRRSMKRYATRVS